MSDLSSLLDLIPHPLIELIVRGDGDEIAHLNPAAAELYGYDSSDVARRDISTLSATPAVALAAHHSELVRTGRWRGEAVHLTRDGRELQVEITAAAVFGTDSPRYVMAVTDVTQRRALTQRLVEHTALLQLAPVAIFARDARRQITFWNRAAETMYGFTAAEVLGRDAKTVLRSEYPIALEEIERIVERDGTWESQLVQTTRDGHRIVVDSRWGAVRDGHGRLVALLEVNRDATERLELAAAREQAAAAAERERLSRRLVRAQRLESLGELAGGIAHDFNNLLAVIAGYSTTLTDAIEDVAARIPDGPRRSILADAAEIAVTTQRAALLTRQLLTFARQESVSTEPVSLNDVVADLTPLLQRTLGEHVLLELELAPALRSIHADPGQLGQVLVNLAVNARDAMPEGGRLAIETRDISIEPHDRERPEIEPGEYVQLTVTDTGTGMEPDVLERAFDPFFTTKPAGCGTGLGLAGVYGIVVNAGGHAALYSEPGHGTTFRASFPALCKPPAAPGSAEPAEPPRAPRESTILLVEDQGPLRAITTRILERAGYRVIAAASGPEALELAETAPSLDLLLTDVVMPQMLGQRLAELLRKTRPQLRVVFASGFARPALEQAGRVLDGPLLQKPFSSHELLALIASELEPR